MIATLAIMALVAATALAAFASDRIVWLKRNPVAIGVLFGLLGIVCNSCASVTLGEFGFCVELRDAPPLVAALFFGPVAGIVAGLVTAVERALTPLWGVGAASLCPFATFLTTLYGVGFRRWLADGHRPTVLQATLAGAWAEFLHLSLDILFNLCIGGVMIEIVYTAIIPEALFIAASAGIAAASCRADDAWPRVFRLPLTAMLILFAASFSIVATTFLRRASLEADEIVRESVAAVKEKADAQIGYMLHCNAMSIANRYDWTKPADVKTMRKIAEDYDVDELNVIGEDGRTIATSDPKNLTGPAFSRDNALTAPFFELVNGTRTFVKQPFRASIDNPSCVAKYIGVPLPGQRKILQLGYHWARLEREFETFFLPMISGTGFGENGYLVLANARQGVIVGSVRNHPEAEGKAISEIGLPPDAKPETVFTGIVCGKGSRCVCCEGVGDWRLYAVLPLIEVFGPANLSVIAMGLVLFLLCATFRMIELNFRKAQRKLDDLRARDLQVAHAIQTAELRTDGFENGVCAVTAMMRTAREVGGDFYDYYELPDGRTIITIADVSGKGVPAAIFMMKAKMALKNAIAGTTSLAEAVAAANAHLCANNAAEMFVTAWTGIFDPASGKLEYVSAGHNPPLVRHADGSVEWIKGRRSLVLAAMDGAKYHANEMSLSSGDRLLLYTDGVTEAMDAQGRQYGEARLEAVFTHAGRDFIGAVDADVSRFACKAEQSDDITMLALVVK